ncbi:MAG: ABC transporter permease [Thermoprotei archaeon]|nr:MAG: ABC transporter permease [Thermoprotei archaeon]
MIGNKRANILLLLIPTLAIMAFFLLSILAIARDSFNKFVSPGIMEPAFTLENYLMFFTTPAYLNVLYRTIRISLVSTALSLIIGYPLAYYIVRGSPLIRRVCTSVTLFSFLTSILVRVFAWRIILGRTGLVNRVLNAFGIPSSASYLGTELAVTIGLVYFLIPFVVFTLVGVIDKIPIELEQAAKTLGANEIITFLKVTLPLSTPGIMAASLISYCLGMSAFIIPLLLGGDQVKMLANIIYDQCMFVVNYPFASAAAIILLVISLVIIVVYQKIVTRGLKY